MAHYAAPNWQAAERQGERLLQEVEQGRVASLYLLVGAEHGPLRRLAHELIARLLPGEERTSLELLTGADLSAAEVAARLAEGGLLFGAPRRVVWVQNAGFLGKDNGAKLQPLLRVLERGLRETVLIITVARQVEATHPLVQWAKGQGVLLEWPSLRYEREAESWVAARLREQGKRASGEALAEMALRCGARLEVLANETEKLVLYVGERSLIGLNDVRAVVTSSPEASTFDLVDAIGESRVVDALQILHTLLQHKTPPLMILGMILRQFRLLLQARTLIDSSPPPEPIWRASARDFRQALGRTDERGQTLLQQWRARVGEVLPQGRASLLSLHPFPFWKVMRQAERFTLPALCRAFERLAQADLALKGNLFSPETVLEMVIVDLGQRMEAGATLDWEELLE